MRHPCDKESIGAGYHGEGKRMDPFIVRAWYTCLQSQPGSKRSTAEGADSLQNVHKGPERLAGQQAAERARCRAYFNSTYLMRPFRCACESISLTPRMHELYLCLATRSQHVLQFTRQTICRSLTFVSDGVSGSGGLPGMHDVGGWAAEHTHAVRVL